jgi:hypothetical protein
MQADIRWKLSMAARALEFSRANPSTDASHVGVVTRLGEQLTRADALAIQERDGRLIARNAVERRQVIRRTLEQQTLRHLMRVATAAARENPTAAGLFALPRHPGPYRTFITSARAMLTAATAHRDLLIQHGLGETTIEYLTGALAEFETATANQHAGRREHVAARAELINVANECVELVGLLDGLNRARYEDDAPLLAAWESARNLVTRYKANAELPATPLPNIPLPSDGTTFMPEGAAAAA